MASQRKARTLLRRYTCLPSLFAILKNREISLLSPSTWDDKNDQNFMEAYARTNGFKTCLALCFCQAIETYHHWKIFTSGTSGVRIDFDRDELLEALPENGFVHRMVQYKTIDELADMNIRRGKLPFVKRRAFRDEKEYRIVFGSRTQELSERSVPIDLGIIRTIVINPWMQKPLYDVTRAIILGIRGCKDIEVFQSSLIDNQSWREYAENYA
jgi:hypothetical protein